MSIQSHSRCIDVLVCPSSSLKKRWKGENELDEKKRNPFTAINIKYGPTFINSSLPGKGFFFFNNGSKSSLKSILSLNKYPRNDMSMSFWMRWVNDTQREPSPFSMNFKTGNTFSMINLRNISFSVNDQLLFSGVSIPDEQWHHLVLMKSNTQFEFLLDGVSVFNSSLNSNFIFPSMSSLTFGERVCSQCNSSKDFFHGEMDEIFIFKRKLTNFESKTLFQKDIFCYDKSSKDLQVCSGKGSCVEPDVCQCQSGYSGYNCEILNQCNGNTVLDPLYCNGNGNCSDNNMCQCNPGFHGDNCQHLNLCNGMNYFNSSSCNKRGKCLFSNKCQCNLGYTGEDCEFKLKYFPLTCSSSGCIATSSLSFLSNGHRFISGVVSVYVDQTDFSSFNQFVEYIKLNNQVIKNRCDPGLSNQCGSLRYPCLEEYKVTSEPFNISGKISSGVVANPCNQQLFSANVSLGYLEKLNYCFSKEGNASNVCSSHGKCVKDDQCLCDAGYTGIQCESTIQCFSISTFNASVCSGKGKCISQDVCQCNQAGFYGKDCGLFNCFGTSRNESNVCSSHGQCTGINQCTCLPSFEGVQCEYPKSNLTQKNFTTTLTCSGVGCLASGELKLNLKKDSILSNVFLDVFVEQVNFNHPTKYIEWISVNNLKILENCRPVMNEKVCGAYFSCLSGVNLLKEFPELSPLTSIQLGVKLSNNVTDLCSNGMSVVVNMDYTEKREIVPPISFGSPFDFYPIFILVVVASLVLILGVLFVVLLIFSTLYYFISYRMSHPPGEKLGNENEPKQEMEMKEY
jgi:hypothetical protein